MSFGGKIFSRKTKARTWDSQKLYEWNMKLSIYRMVQVETKKKVKICLNILALFSEYEHSSTFRLGQSYQQTSCVKIFDPFSP